MLSAVYLNNNIILGIVTSDEVEVLCGFLSMADLNEMNDAMGGEPASKESALVQAKGIDLIATSYIIVY